MPTRAKCQSCGSDDAIRVPHADGAHGESWLCPSCVARYESTPDGAVACLLALLGVVLMAALAAWWL